MCLAYFVRFAGWDGVIALGAFALVPAAAIAGPASFQGIGDLAGAKIAYRAFKISQRGKPAPADVDGFTQDQQFFIAWGQFRGDAVRPEFARTMVQGDPHPIGKYRVIGPLSNLPEFQRAFSCKANSPMVRPPQERCEVW